jgi:Ca-activated chloride channel family protein
MHDYIPRLWASRRVALLQRQLRSNGHSQELVDEIVDLGLRYGIITEYTSFLIREPDAQVARALREGDGFAAMPSAAQEEMDARLTRSRETTGRDAVARAKRESKMAAADSAPMATSPGVMGSADAWTVPGEPVVAGARMQLDRWIFRADEAGRWIDHRAEGAKPRLRIQAYGQAWFELAELRPELRPLMGIGSTVRIVVGHDVLEIGSEGVEQLSSKDRRWLASSAI